MFNLPECRDHSYANIKTRKECPKCIDQLRKKLKRIFNQTNNDSDKKKSLANEMQNGQYFGPETNLPLYRRIDFGWS